jgi:multidrug efflux pump subunit AcrA (membrane-fusion protein)
MPKNKVYIAASSVLAIILLISWFFQESTEDTEIVVSPRTGKFEIVVVATGELEAKNSKKINVPDVLRSVRVFQVKIADLIPEGTKVSKGDYVGSLDKSEIAEKLRLSETERQKLRNQFIQNRLDTSLSLRNERSEMLNLASLLREKENTLKMMKYETYNQIKQAETDVEKAKRAYQQASENYQIKRQQASAKMFEVGGLLSEEDRKSQEILSAMDIFTITAPDDGIVIYHREWNGQKRTVGSFVSDWDAVVATLPDLSGLVSRTYINEMDISKIKIGQKVQIRTDAIPNQIFEGKVIQIASVGEQRPNNDAKVFEVKIELLKTNENLRPTMTTQNTIFCESIEKSLFLPLECIHTDANQKSYVFVKDGSQILKKQVCLGKNNENEIIIKEGVEANEQVYLSVPTKSQNALWVALKNEKKLK